MSMPLLLHGQEGHARISIYYEFFFAMTNLPPQLVALSRENKEHSLSEGGDSRSHPKQRNKKLEDDFVEFVF